VDAPLLQDAAGARLRPEDIQSILACAAFDAGLTGAGSVTADVLRHTCIAWLVRQGLRFSELGSLVGRPSPEALALYATMAPEGRNSAPSKSTLMPALRAMAGRRQGPWGNTRIHLTSGLWLSALGHTA
jgi:hypothetical protein